MTHVAAMCLIVLPMETRTGFTLIEMMVAVMLLAVGMLGLASTAAFVARQMGEARMQSRAATAAMSRFERLRAVDCSTLAGSGGGAGGAGGGGGAGTSSARGIRESWNALRDRRAVIITDTVTHVTPRGARSNVYRSGIPCPAIP
ncbi:MAG: type IV pilus modification PilV family protein [Gemmatimonadaceae bacterium]